MTVSLDLVILYFMAQYLVIAIAVIVDDETDMTLGSATGMFMAFNILIVTISLLFYGAFHADYSNLIMGG